MGLAFVVAGWLLGVAAAAFSGAEAAAGVAAAGLLGVACFRVRPSVWTLAALPVAFLALAAGFWRYEATVPDPDSGVASLNGTRVRVLGVVSEEPLERTASLQYRVEVRALREGGAWRDQDGSLLVTAPLSLTFDYGDLVEIRGELESPPVFPGFDYREYLLRKGVTSVMAYPRMRLVEGGHGEWWRERLYDVRGSVEEALDAALPEPESSLAAGVLLGARRSMPLDLREDMQATGTSHLVAVSGQNITLLAGLVVAALAWLIGRRPAAWLALAAVAGYALLVGLQPSVLRAAIMAAVYVLATVSGRQSSTPVALGLAAALMTGLHPQIVHDVAFQLSVAATMGLVVLAPELQRRLDVWFADVPMSRPVAETASVTLAAIAFTLPITAINFGQVSLVAPVANLFAVPAFLAVAATSALGAALTAAAPDEAAAWVAWPAAAYMTGVIRFFAEVPFASVELRGVSVGWAVGWYVLLALAVWRLSGRPVAVPEERRWVSPRAAAAGVGLVATVLLAAGAAFWALRDGDERLTVTVLDVGQGEAVLIEDADGRRVLVDGGPSGQALQAALGRNLPFNDRRIDLVVLTHPQEDHVGGLVSLLDSYDVGGVLTGPGSADTLTYARWLEALRAARLPYTTADAGQSVALTGARLDVLGPDADDPLLPVRGVNESSVVLRLTAGEVSFLLTGDLGARGEAAVMRSGRTLEATVLKVGHHGSRSGTTPQFLARVAPAVGVVSVGRDNSFGHPASETLDRLGAVALYRTDEDGDVRFSTDGVRLWVETER